MYHFHMNPDRRKTIVSRSFSNAFKETVVSAYRMPGVFPVEVTPQTLQTSTHNRVAVGLDEGVKGDIEHR